MMMDRNAKDIGYAAQLAIFLGLTVGGLIAGTALIPLIWNLTTGQSIFTMEKGMLDPANYYVVMTVQAVSTFCVFFLPAYFFAKICYRVPGKFLGFNLNINYRQVALVLAIILLTLPLSAALGELTRILPIPRSWAIKFTAMEAAREAQEAALIQINSFFKYVLSLFIIALLPAIFEEVYFRAAMQNIFTRWFKGPWIAIIVTSIIFSVIHLSFYGFFVRFALGVILGFIFHYSGTVWLSVLFHFLFNGIQVTILYVMNGSGVKKVDDLEKNFPLWIGAVALIMLLYLFEKFRQISALQQLKDVKDLPENDFHDSGNNQPK